MEDWDTDISGSKYRDPVDASEIGDRFKLIMDRLIAMRLRYDQSPIQEAIAVIEIERARFEKSPGTDGEFIRAWSELLRKTPVEIRNAIVRRGDRMQWMRSISPFDCLPSLDDLGFQNVEYRLRMRRKARLGRMKLKVQVDEVPHAGL